MIGSFWQDLRHGVSPADPVAFAAIVLLLGAVSLLACWLPARRAARLELRWPS
jgi:ABC-type lipoprotein release transport system permease subunit